MNLCIIKLRVKEDNWNSFYAGTLTSMVLAINSYFYEINYLIVDKKLKGLLLSSIGGGIFGMVKYFLFKNLKVMQNFSFTGRK